MSNLKNDIIDVLYAFAKVSISIGVVYFTLYFLHAITFGLVPEENIRFADMVLGALIGILGVLGKVILDTFTNK